MQNLLIIGAVVIVAVGGFLLLQSQPAADVMEDGMDAAMLDDMGMNDAMEDETVAAETPNDIVDTAVATPELSTLVAAVSAAELVTTLQSAGPFTVFAPVNEAFAALPAGTVETLLLPENQADLQAILTYHVVAGAVMAGDLVDGMEVQTVNGETLTINVAADGGVTINDSAAVVIADIVTSNGVVHVIDGVLLPPAV